MDVWRDIILLLAVFAMFAFGFCLMTKLDKFLNENRKAIEKENESCEPTCVMLSKNLTEEEVVEEIRKFRSAHEEACIVLYDSLHQEEEKVLKNNP